MIKDERIRSLLHKYENIYSLKYLILLSNWDIETYMPKNGITTRGIVTGKIESLSQKLFLDPELVSELKKIHADQSKLNDVEKAIVRCMWHTYDRYTKLPPEFVEAFANLVSTSSTVWAKAKSTNNYELFKPYLQEIIDMTLQYCKYMGYKKHPYEALIEDYEPGMTMENYEEYFTKLKSVLSQFDIHKIQKEPTLPSSFSIKHSQEITKDILKLLGADPSSTRIDESAHPFTNAIGVNDIRLTTNYNNKSPFSSIYSTIHEFGHGLFGLQTAKELEFTPLFTEISYGLHESQSRFWENIIGRSKDFIKWLQPKIATLSDEFKKLSVDDIYNIVNHVHPSLIRIEADELTYHYHILIRYEVEKALLEKEITVDEAPEYWNSKYEQYLGIRPDSFANGILQDIHWSIGAIGYFPSYSFGTVMSAVIGEKVKHNVSDIEETKIWLKENIHQFGGTYTYTESSERLTGKSIDLEPWEKYMKEKFNHLLIK